MVRAPVKCCLGKSKRKKGMKNAYGNNGTPVREIMSVSLKLQKEKRGANGRKTEQRNNMRTSQTWGKIWTSKFSKLIGHLQNFNPKQSFPRHIIIKLNQSQRENFLNSQEKIFSLIQCGNPNKGITIFFSKKPLSLERKWDDVFKGLKEKKNY